MNPNAATGRETGKLHGLDHLRTAAIAMVFLFHYFILSHGAPHWLPDVASFGWTGVDLFFVLSGFLIASQLFTQLNSGQTIRLRSFFRKRFFRIIPAYLFTLILYFGVPFFREKEALPPLWKFLTFTQNFGLNLSDNGTFSHAWSLCVEEHFYLVLPLLLSCAVRFGLFRYTLWLLPLLLLGGIAIRHFSYTQFYLPESTSDASWVYWYRSIYYPTYNRMDGLLAGVAIAAAYIFTPRSFARFTARPNYLLLSGLVVLTAAYFLCRDQQSYAASVYGFPLIALAYGLIVTAAISPACILYRLNSRVTTLIASLSYGIYLTHKGVIHMTHRLLQELHLHQNLLLVICMCTCLLTAYLVHISIERPFMRLRNKRI